MCNIITGTRRPNIEKQKAPISPINGEIVGTATASKTAAVTKTVLNKRKIIKKIKSHKNCCRQPKFTSLRS